MTLLIDGVPEGGDVLRILAIVLALYLLYHASWTYHVIRTLPRDLSALMTFIHVTVSMKLLARQGKTVPELFDETAARRKDATAIIFEDQRWTFTQLRDRTNAVANYFSRQGYKKGDVVSLFMDQRPEFIAFWLGLAKLGVQVALINFNLRGAPLRHCISTVSSRAIIVGSELSSYLKEVQGELEGVEEVFISGGKQEGYRAVDEVLSAESTAPDYPRHPGDFHEKLLFIFTSGTTGLPKAAIVRNDRFYYQFKAINVFFRIRPADIIYVTLPIYHSAGGVVGVGNMLLAGATIVLKKKFSASNFFKDCTEHKCTVIQYIGEIVRYLNSTAPSPYDTAHNVRVAIGNGLNGKVWAEFQERFHIPQVGEFYGATEGNTSMVNSVNRTGACGFNSIFLPFVYPVRTVRFDVENEELIRDKRGFCIPCRPGEIGELIGYVNMKSPLRKYDGYVGQEHTQKKIARDVFRKGDIWFRTGDLLMMDADGFYYFKDRIGDTFRWRGENVSTAEVEEVVARVLNNSTPVAVYGVQVPGSDGRGGMLAIGGGEEEQVEGLYEKLKSQLPSYAVPLFIRLLQSMETTGTHKIVKTTLKQEEFHPERVGKDPVLVLDRKEGKYVPLDAARYQQIMAEQWRF